MTNVRREFSLVQHVRCSPPRRAPGYNDVKTARVLTYSLDLASMLANC